MRMVVVLPAPLGPTKPKISPPGTLKSTSWRATRPPYLLCRPSTAIIGCSPVVEHQAGLARLALVHSNAHGAGGQLSAAQGSRGAAAGGRLHRQRSPAAGGPVEDFDGPDRGLGLQRIQGRVSERGTRLASARSTEV